MRAALRERLTEKIQRGSRDECWPFLGARTPDGYGVLRDDDGRLTYAHRATLALRGIDVAGKVVRHRCDNPPCCNPRHLKAGTHAENMGDFYERGHGNRGTANGNAKLTDADVLEIRRLAGTVSQRKLARRFGVAPSVVSAVVLEITWAHVQAA